MTDPSLSAGQENAPRFAQPDPDRLRQLLDALSECDDYLVLTFQHGSREEIGYRRYFGTPAAAMLAKAYLDRFAKEFFKPHDSGGGEDD